MQFKCISIRGKSISDYNTPARQLNTVISAIHRMGQIQQRSESPAKTTMFFFMIFFFIVCMAENHNSQFWHAQVCEITLCRSFQRIETLNGNCFFCIIGSLLHHFLLTKSNSASRRNWMSTIETKHV